MSYPLAVVTPLYATESNQRLAYFEKTAESILASQIPFQWIIVNDDSPDPNTKPFLANLQDGRIVVVNRKKEAGDIATASNALNLGISVALEQDAKTITYVHSDDILFPESLEKRLSIIQSGHDMACGRIAYIHGESAHIPITSTAGVLHAFETECYKFPHHTSMWTQEMVKAMINQRGFLFDKAISYGEDLDVSLLGRETIQKQKFSIGVSDAVVYGWVGSLENITQQTKKKTSVDVLKNHRAYKDMMHLFADTAFDVVRKNIKQPLFWLPESVKARLQPIKATVRKMSGGKLYKPYCEVKLEDATE